MNPLALCLSVTCLSFAVLPATGSEERRLTGVEITEILSGVEVIGEGTRQRFYESGRTLYQEGRDSWGYWRVQGDQYCSQWPPNESWNCYDMRSWEEGQTVWVTWVGPSGKRYDGYVSQ